MVDVMTTQSTADADAGGWLKIKSMKRAGATQLATIGRPKRDRGMTHPREVSIAGDHHVISYAGEEHCDVATRPCIFLVLCSLTPLPHCRLGFRSFSPQDGRHQPHRLAIDDLGWLCFHLVLLPLCPHRQRHAMAVRPAEEIGRCGAISLYEESDGSELSPDRVGGSPTVWLIITHTLLTSRLRAASHARSTHCRTNSKEEVRPPLRALLHISAAMDPAAKSICGAGIGASGQLATPQRSRDSVNLDEWSSTAGPAG